MLLTSGGHLLCMCRQTVCVSLKTICTWRCVEQDFQAQDELLWREAGRQGQDWMHLEMREERNQRRGPRKEESRRMKSRREEHRGRCEGGNEGERRTKRKRERQRQQELQNQWQPEREISTARDWEAHRGTNTHPKRPKRSDWEGGSNKMCEQQGERGGKGTIDQFSTCWAKVVGKLHVNKYSKQLPPTIFLPLDSGTAITQSVFHSAAKPQQAASAWRPAGEMMGSFWEVVPCNTYRILPAPHRSRWVGFSRVSTWIKNLSWIG